jgi:hypothetical protein
MANSPCALREALGGGGSKSITQFIPYLDKSYKLVVDFEPRPLYPQGRKAVPIKQESK